MIAPWEVFCYCNTKIFEAIHIFKGFFQKSNWLLIYHVNV